MATTRARNLRLAPDVRELEGRTLLSTGSDPVAAQQVAAGAAAYVTQVYYDLLGRAPTEQERSDAAGRLDSGRVDRRGFVGEIVGSEDYARAVVRTYYERFLDRAPEEGALDFWAGRIRSGRSPQFGAAQVGILSSQEYYVGQGGGTAAGFVRALYSDVLRRGVGDEAQFWVDQLQRGVARDRVVQGIVGSDEAALRQLDDDYGQFLDRTPDPSGVATFTAALRRGAGPAQVLDGLLTSPEYVGRNQAVTRDVVDTLLADPNYSILAQAVQAAGLVETLRGAGPFTVFAPTDAAFNALPSGTLQSLLQPANRQQLVDLLTYHVVAGRSSGAELAMDGLATTVQGAPVGVAATAGGGLRINTSNVVSPNVRAENGIIHGIDRVLTLPTGNIVQTAISNPDLSTLVQAVQAAGLVDTLSGPGPFTVFAPTNAAFAALPAGTLDTLLRPANRQQLVDVLTYHVTPGRFSAQGLAAQGQRASVAGPTVRFSRRGDGFAVNGSNVVVANVVTTNGIVQVIDAVLTPPSTA